MNIKSIVLVAITLIFSVSANAGIVVGSFDSSRINYAGGAFETGFYSVLRNDLANRGDSIQTISSITASNLQGVDVFYTSLLSTSTGGLSVSEQSALVAWVNGGGTLFTAGDVLNWQAVFNTFLNPFGINMSTDATPYSVGSGTIVDTSNPIINGPNGLVTSFDYATSGVYDAGAYNTFATDSIGNAILIQQAFGLGQVVAIGDHNLFTDTYIGLNEETLFLNVLDSSTAVPVPAAVWLLGSGLLGLLGVARKNKA